MLHWNTFPTQILKFTNPGILRAVSLAAGHGGWWVLRAGGHLLHNVRWWPGGGERYFKYAKPKSQDLLSWLFSVVINA